MAGQSGGSASASVWAWERYRAPWAWEIYRIPWPERDTAAPCCSVWICQESVWLFSTNFSTNTPHCLSGGCNGLTGVVCNRPTSGEGPSVQTSLSCFIDGLTSPGCHDLLAWHRGFYECDNNHNIYECDNNHINHSKSIQRSSGRLSSWKMIHFLNLCYLYCLMTST